MNCKISELTENLVVRQSVALTCGLQSNRRVMSNMLAVDEDVQIRIEVVLGAVDR
jgi:hypothetical protein